MMKLEMKDERIPPRFPGMSHCRKASAGGPQGSDPVDDVLGLCEERDLLLQGLDPAREHQFVHYARIYRPGPVTRRAPPPGVRT